MATTLNLYQAKTQLSKLVERAAAGEEIVIAKAGKPMVRLVPVEAYRPKQLVSLACSRVRCGSRRISTNGRRIFLPPFEADIEPVEQASSSDQADERR